MLYSVVSREELLTLLPKGGRVAEIGTYSGEFAEIILERTQPVELHLIDPWSHQEHHDEGNTIPDEIHNKNFRHVSEIFATEINSGRVTLHRTLSEDAATCFEDGYFDWIYIDGDHSRAAVAQDLALFSPKVAQGGLVLGHDYNNDYIYADHFNFGVVEAVNNFVMENDWEFVCLNSEHPGTYALARKPLSGHGELLALQLLRNIKDIIEVRDFPRNGYKNRLIDFPDGFKRMLTSF